MLVFLIMFEWLLFVDQDPNCENSNCNLFSYLFILQTIDFTLHSLILSFFAHTLFSFLELSDDIPSLFVSSLLQFSVLYLQGVLHDLSTNKHMKIHSLYIVHILQGILNISSRAFALFLKSQ